MDGFKTDIHNRVTCKSQPSVQGQSTQKDKEPKSKFRRICMMDQPQKISSFVKMEQFPVPMTDFQREFRPKKKKQEQTNKNNNNLKITTVPSAEALKHSEKRAKGSEKSNDSASNQTAYQMSENKSTKQMSTAIISSHVQQPDTQQQNNKAMATTGGLSYMRALADQKGGQPIRQRQRVEQKQEYNVRPSLMSSYYSENDELRGIDV